MLLVALAFTAGWLGSSLLNGVPSSARPYSADIWQAWNDIDQNYPDVSAINHQKMAYAMLSAMVDSLGDTGHSRFLTPAEVNQLNQQLNNNSFVGIGVYIQQVPIASGNGNDTVIEATLPNSPAQKAGLLPGDVFLTINGQDATNKTPDQIQQLIAGKKGTSVTITVQRAGKTQPVPFTITRGDITAPIVNPYMFSDHIGYVQITGFDTGTTKELTSDLKTLQGEGMKAVILDLRDNGGGLVDEAQGVAGDFLPNGSTVLYEKDRSGTLTPVKVDDKSSPAPGLHLSIPMVVLVNGGTASASEIVTGALQDDRHVQAIGERTFGTDTVLGTFQLSDGSELLLATQQYLTPAKRQYKPGLGLTPDQTVTLPANAFPESALALQEANLSETNVLAGKGLTDDTQLIAA
ncbi:MAG TPA: S41 family peptidase, partial [Ktedonobacterales bacterium]|nr:S41 family peptidase [Ktedonobacterales bacterium]